MAAVVRTLNGWRSSGPDAELREAAFARVRELARGADRPGMMPGGPKLRTVAVPLVSRPLLDAVPLTDGRTVDGLVAVARSSEQIPQAQGVESQVAPDDSIHLDLASAAECRSPEDDLRRGYSRRMPVHFHLAGAAAKLSGGLATAAARRGKTFWDRNHEGHNLIKRVGALVRQDAEVPGALREQLAAQLAERIRPVPEVQGALALLLDGEDVDAATAALSQLVSQLTADAVHWPGSFSADNFGDVVARHAQEAVNEVKASDRAAAHVDEKHTRKRVEGVRAAVDDVRDLMIEITDEQRETEAREHQGMQRAIQELLGRKEAGTMAAALVAGPLEHAGQSEAADHAADLEQHGGYVQAADVVLEIASALDGAGLGAVADSYRIRAARLLVRAEDRDAALALLEKVAWTQIELRNRAATSAIFEMQQLVGETWLVRGLDACASWPQLPWASASLDAAIEADEDADRLMRWRAARVQIESLMGEPQSVLDLTSSLPQPMDAGARLALELDRIDALDAVADRVTADRLWADLSDWADTQAGPHDQAVCWQRRGSQLAHRGALNGARQAYRRAIAAWARSDSEQANAADALFSLQQVESLLGVWFPDLSLRALAASVKESMGVPGRGDALLHSAAANRIAGNLREAHREYWLALGLFQSQGDLIGVHVVQNHLAELYEASDRPLVALALRIQTGSSKKATAVAGQVPAAEAAEVLTNSRAPWECATAYEVLAVFGSTAPPQLVDDMADRLLEDVAQITAAERPPRWSEMARLALASVVLQMPPATRDDTLRHLRAGVRDLRMLDAARASATGLIRATQLGLTDATTELVELFLGGRPLNDISPTWVADVIDGDLELRAKVIDAAKTGSVAALSALMWADPAEGEIGVWHELAEPLAKTYLEVRAVEEREVDGVAQQSHSIGVNFVLGGLAARYATERVRLQLKDHLLATAANDIAVESSRAAALLGLFNFIGALPEGAVREVSVAALPLASGEYEHSDLESAEVDPLSSVQMSSDTVGMLQAAALKILGRAEQVQPGATTPEVRSAVRRAVVHPLGRVRAAVLDVFARVPQWSEGIDLEPVLGDRDAEVRREAVKAMFAKDEQRLGELLPNLVADPSYGVRLLLINLAARAGRDDLLRAMSESDPDAYLRGLARKALC